MLAASIFGPSVCLTFFALNALSWGKKKLGNKLEWKETRCHLRLFLTSKSDKLRCVRFVAVTTKFAWKLRLWGEKLVYKYLELYAFTSCN